MIAERGIEGLSLRGLARDLEVSHAAPGAHFADRKALLCALAKEGFRRIVEAMQAGAEAVGSDPVARYRAIGRSYLQFALENPSYFRAIRHPEVQAHADAELNEAQAEFFATLRDGVAAAQAAGWHPEIEITTLLAFSCAAAMGAAELLSDPISCRELGIQDVDRLADSVLDLVVHRSPARLISTAAPAAEHRRNPS